jgi:hypothetical protein
MGLVGMKGPGKAGSAQHSLPGAEDKTRTLNLRIKIGRMNTEPMKSVRGKSLPSFTMYKITHVSLNCGPQTESSPQFFTCVADRNSRSLPEVHCALRHSGVLFRVTCNEGVLPTLMFSCFLPRYVEQATSVWNRR